jgi:hypothetical protein
MKKNIYGNIEDLVVRARMVTPRGTVEKNFLVRTEKGERGTGGSGEREGRVGG